MFKKDNTPAPASASNGGKNVESLIAKDMVITGEVESRGSIRVDGYINGTLTVENSVFIGTGGTVKANLQATNFVVAGTFEGNAKVTEKITLHPTGRLLGDIVCQALVMEDGGFFQGNCTMTKSGGRPTEGKAPIIETEKKA